MPVFDHVRGLLREERWEDALNELLDPQSGNVRSPYSQDMNHAWYTIGDIHYKRHEFQKALKAFQLARKYDNDDYQAIWAIASCHSEIGNHAFAEKFYQTALSYGFEVDQISYNLACEMFDQGKFKAALRQFKNIVTDDESLAEKIKKNIHLASTELRKGVRK